MDSAASGHYVEPHIVPIIQPAEHPTAIELPNGTSIVATQTGQLPIAHPTLPQEAKTALVISEFDRSLLSLGQLCFYGCTATLNSQKAIVDYRGDTIVTGTFDPNTKCWMTDPAPNTQVPQPLCNALTAIREQCNVVHSYDPMGPRSPKAQRATLLHAICFSPALSTWCKAIQAGHFVSWPGLTTSLVLKYPPHSQAMHKGHLDQIRQHLRSTKKPKPVHKPEHDVYVQTIECADIPAKVYSDSTGTFLIPSSRGNRYLLVVYHRDSNFIFAEPMPSKTAEQILKAYQTVHQLLVSRGLKPELKIMDNEASDMLKKFLIQEQVPYQLVPPNVHRRNAAEKAIRTFKNHFIAGLCSVDPAFPLHLWDLLLPQALITLNLMRTSRLDTNISAYQQIYGHFDFKATPLGPPGCKILCHDKAHIRGTWAPHATEGWYVGPALETYRAFKVYIPTTGAQRITDTIAWLPAEVVMPTESALAAATTAAQDLVQALLRPSSSMAHLSEGERATLATLATIFANRLLAPDPPTGTAPTVPTPLEIPDAPAPTPTVPAEPRVIATQVQAPTVPAEPRVIADQQAPTMAGDPRVNPSQSSAPITYASINHNARQRRRRNKKRTAVTADDVTHKTSNKTGKGKRKKPAAKPTTPAEEVPLPPTVPPTIEPPALQAPENPSATRRSTRPKLVARFDSRSHKRLVNCVTITTTNTVNAAITVSHRALVNGEHAEEWWNATMKEFGRLAQGMPGLVEGTDTMFFIAHDAKPANRKATYTRIVCDYNPAKAEPFRVRLTAGGDQVEYPGYVSTPTVDISTVKCQLNSVLSTPNARYMTFDISNFYLNTPMEHYEYMRIPISAIPQAVIEHYNLTSLVHKGFVMVELRKGIYGLPQAGILANQLLITRLAEGGYHPAPYTPGLYLHQSNGLSFTLWVDDFGVKYTSKEQVEHLLTLLKKYYSIKEDWTGSKYLGLSLKWDYAKGTLDVSMPGYIDRALKRFQHPMPIRPQHSPHAWTAPQYGSRVQQTDDPDDSKPLEPSDIQRLQQIIGVLLYYARMVDMTMLVAIGTIASEQAKGTKKTMDAAIQLLNYAATHPNATIRYTKSDMVLHIISDASYLSASEARSRLGGYLFLSDKVDPSTISNPDSPPPTFNAPVLVNSAIISAVLSSAGEAELAALFYNAKDGAMLQQTLEALGHPQPATPIQADNACAVGIANETIKQKRSKAIDMRFYWVRDRVRAGQFTIYWKRGVDNQADYFTKHHPTSHHRKSRSTFLHEEEDAANSE